MPPKQCPECGRFLASAFVAALAEDPATCPKCDVELTTDGAGSPVPVDGPSGDVVDVAAQADAPVADAAPLADAGARTPARAAAAEPARAPSPPTAPAAPGARDPLQGWDTTGRRPAPPDPGGFDPQQAAPFVGGGLLLGLLLGGRDHRVLGGVLGTLLGLVAALLADD